MARRTLRKNSCHQILARRVGIRRPPINQLVPSQGAPGRTIPVLTCRILKKKRWMGMLTDRRNPYLHILDMLSTLAPPTPRNWQPSPSWAHRPEGCGRTPQQNVYGFRYTDPLRGDGNIFAHLFTLFG